MTPGIADPSLYPKLRQNAMNIRMPGVADGLIHAVLMDWHVGSGTATVLAARDGSASIYLSSGGGFIGGGQGSEPIHEAIRQAAIAATALAQELLPAHALQPVDVSLPAEGEVNFYATTNGSVVFTRVDEQALRSGTDPLAPLGNAMQRVIGLYRTWSEQQRPS